MNKGVFRQAALDQATAPERLDEMLAVTRAGDWLWLFAIALALAAAGAWSVEGRIARKVEGQGLLLLPGGVVNIVAEGTGRIRELRARPGDSVEVNQAIGSVNQSSTEDRLKALAARKSELERERARTAESRARGLALQSAALAGQRESLGRDIANHRQQIAILDEQIETEQELVDKGLIVPRQLLDTRQRRAAAEAAITSIQARLKELDSSRFQAESQSEQADRDAEAAIAESQRSIDLLRRELDQVSLIRSRYAGKILEVKLQPGALVNAGEPVASVEPRAGGEEVVAYVSSARVKELASGMIAEISPASARREEYGFIRGRVVSVAEFPATRAAMMRNFENESVAAAMMAAGPVNEVRIELLRDGSTFSGFAWSAGQGPPVRITSGTLCSARIVTREQAPIHLAVPFLKDKLGMN